MHFKLGELINKDVLRQEIKDVKKAHNKRRIVGVEEIEVESNDEISSLLAESELTQLLLLWCKEICSTFGVVCEDFTEDMADGRVLCLLLHYYHPGLLERREIHWKVAKEVKGGSREETVEAVRNEQVNRPKLPPINSPPPNRPPSATYCSPRSV